MTSTVDSIVQTFANVSSAKLLEQLILSTLLLITSTVDSIVHTLASVASAALLEISRLSILLSITHTLLNIVGISLISIAKILRLLSINCTLLEIGSILLEILSEVLSIFAVALSSFWEIPRRSSIAEAKKSNSLSKISRPLVMPSILESITHTLLAIKSSLLPEQTRLSILE